jgi:hypothetical protein
MNRELVQSVLDRFSPEQLIGPTETFDNLRRRILPHVIDVLPGKRGRWGVLRKSGGSVPSDIVVDGNDQVHYDVFSGTDLGDGRWKVTATWGKIGFIAAKNPNWRWMSVEESGIVPLEMKAPDQGGPGGEEPPTDDEMERRVKRIETILDFHKLG